MASIEARISLYDHVAVYNSTTKEILACIPLVSGDDGFVKDNIEFKLYPKGTEPVFREEDGIIKLSENATVFKNLT
jgi:hypothetical protein